MAKTTEHFERSFEEKKTCFRKVELFNKINARHQTAQITSQKNEQLNLRKQIHHEPYSPYFSYTVYHLFRSLQKHCFK